MRCIREKDGKCTLPYAFAKGKPCVEKCPLFINSKTFEEINRSVQDFMHDSRVMAVALDQETKPKGKK